MGGKRGMDCELSIGAGPTVVGEARNAKLNGSTGEIDVSSRGSAGWKEILPSLNEWSVDCDAVWVTDSAALELLITAWHTRASIFVKLLDQLVAGAQAQGFSGTAYITKLERAESFNDAVMLSITLKGTGALTLVDPT
jgi:predicted secreted protein